MSSNEALGGLHVGTEHTVWATALRCYDKRYLHRGGSTLPSRGRTTTLADINTLSVLLDLGEVMISGFSLSLSLSQDTNSSPEHHINKIFTDTKDND